MLQLSFQPGASVKKAASTVAKLAGGNELMGHLTWTARTQYEHEVASLQRFLVDASVSGGMPQSSFIRPVHKPLNGNSPGPPGPSTSTRWPPPAAHSGGRLNVWRYSEKKACTVHLYNLCCACCACATCECSGVSKRGGQCLSTIRKIRGERSRRIISFLNGTRTPILHHASACRCLGAPAIQGGESGGLQGR